MRAGSWDGIAPDDCARALGLASGVAERTQPALTLPLPKLRFGRGLYATPWALKKASILAQASALAWAL